MSTSSSVLIVDDERIIRDGLLSFPWRELGFSSVEGVADGGEAIEILTASSVDLLITDLRMPVVDGLALCRTVRERWPAIRTVILTGHRDFDAVRQALQSRVVEYLLKPVDPFELEQLVRRIKAEIDEAHRVASIPLKEPGSFAVVRGLSPTTVSPEAMIQGIGAALGARLIGQTTSGSDLILFLDGSVSDGDLALTLGNVGPFHIGLGTTVPAALAAVESGFYAPGTPGLWIKPAPPLPRAPKEEALLVQLTLDGRVEEVPTALENLTQAWALENRPDPVELRDRMNRLLDQVLEVLLQHSIAVTWITKGDLSNAVSFIDFWDLCRRYFLRAVEEVQSQNQKPHSSSRWAVLQAVRHIEEHFSQPLSLGELASLSRLNPSYFSIQFKKETGANYVDFIKRVRVDNASQLLRSTDLKIYEVASAVGYNDTKYFSEIFKEVTGITPLAYRQKIVAS